MATPPAYPATVTTNSATAASGMTHTATGGFDQVSLPTIVKSGAAAGQATVGDLVYVRCAELGGAIVVDANTALVLDGLTPLNARYYVASANLVWKAMVAPAFPVTQASVAPGGGLAVLAFGLLNAPTAIAAPGTFAGCIQIVLADGTFAYVPYWK
jgi:hypothetical protein